MKIVEKKLIFLLIMVFLVSGLFARALVEGGETKKLDQFKYHNVGNIWLRVSNYGFFGSGDNTPQWPSLEYPGGSAIDYLYQGALWFGAKKIRKDEFGRKLYWKPNARTKDDVVPEGDSLWTPDLKLVIDTLVTVGFDGDLSLYEFLPAYNQLETSALGSNFSLYNPSDTVLYASIRKQRRGVDDDGDGMIDEDPAGYSFPFRDVSIDPNNLPRVFQSYTRLTPAEFQDYSFITNNYEIWFPLGFVDLGDTTNTLYDFAKPTDDDGDGLYDEDGYPVSEQDFIGYYYDYSPFGTAGQRDYGNSKSSNDHVPLNVRVRQMSYQWSYDYIKNLVYIEFDITNMNRTDTLYDCCMGVYMDSDVGPQSMGAQQRADDDVSSYYRPFEFAYTYDADHDGGITPGYVGSRVCTPDPDSLEFACWTWQVGDGPDDTNPQVPPLPGKTKNEKYKLLSGNNPDESKYTSLRDFPHVQEEKPVDTRYLFAFYGDMHGFDAPTTASWNLEPGRTMKIVIAIFPGMSETDLQNSAKNAKTIYGQPQELTTVILPDTFPHYQPSEPPAIPNSYVELVNDGNAIDVYWDNRSQIENVDYTNVPKDLIGWQNLYPDRDSYIGNYDPNTFPPEFAPDGNYNNGAYVNPWTGYRLRHDFEGYSVYGRSGSGSQEMWMKIGQWDKIQTQQDLNDYSAGLPYIDLGAFDNDYGKNSGFPQKRVLTEADSAYFKYYKLDDMYSLVHYQAGDVMYGEPIYNTLVYSEDLQNQADALSFEDQALLFKNPNISDRLYLALYDDALIPLAGHQGAHNVVNGQEKEEFIKSRLARFYYKTTIYNPPKGVEYYVAVTAYDRGVPSTNLAPQESGRDADANMKVVFPGPLAKSEMDNIVVIPNPYIARSSFDGRRENDEKGDRSRRLWFANIPKNCDIKIYTLAGDLVDTVHHDPTSTEDIITISKAASYGIPASGIASWDLLSRYDQIIAPGVYLYSVKNLDTGDIKVGKFVIIK